MKSKLKVIQEEVSDCGVCSLLSIIRYYGGNASLEELRIETETSIYGVNAYNLIKCAKKYGFYAEGIKEYNIERTNFPYIAHLKINNSLSHFVVVYKVYDEWIEIMDPASGFQKITIDKFKEKFTGIIIKLYKVSEIPHYQKTNKIFQIYKELFQKNKTTIILIVLTNIIYIVLSILNSYYIHLQLKYINILFRITLAFIFLELVRSLTKFILEFISTSLENNMSSVLHKNFFSLIFNLPLKYIKLKKSGELLSRVEELESVQEFINKVIINVLINIITLIPIILFLISINYFIGIILLIFIIITIPIYYIYGKNIKKYLITNIESRSNYNNKLIDYFNNITSINHNRSGGFALKELSNSYNLLLTSILKITTNSNRYLTLASFIENILVIITNTIILYFNKNLENIIIVNYLINVFLNCYNNLVSLIPIYSYIKTYLNKTNEFFEIKFENQGDKTFKNGDIIIKNLSFSYDQILFAFENLNIKIEKNEKIIISSPSGNGKSTLCRLLIKEIPIKNNHVMINGVDINDINTNELQKNIFYSSQEEHLFLATIKENIVMDKPLNQEYFNTICELCALNSFVNNKINQYDTYLFGGGNELSGGEKQRILLARALYADRDIILLDETLSELNPDLELNIIKNIFTYFKDKTIIYISHKKINYPGKHLILERKNNGNR